MTTYPPNPPDWIERVKAAVERAAAEHRAADQQLADAQRLAAQRHRVADSILAAVIRQVEADCRGVACGREMTIDQETSIRENLTIIPAPISTKQRSKQKYKKKVGKKSLSKIKVKAMKGLMEESQEVETEQIMIDLLSSTSQQRADQPQMSPEEACEFLHSASERNSASEYQPPTNNDKTQTRPGAQLEDPLWFAGETLTALIANTSDETNEDLEESMQLLAAMWMELVVLRDADPHEAKLRRAAVIAEQVVTDESRAAARTVTDHLKGLPDRKLLSLQFDIERAWHNFEQSLDPDDDFEHSPRPAKPVQGSCVLL